MKKENAHIERYYFGLFQKCYDLPNGSISYGDKPDVMINTGSSLVGIEITNLYTTHGSENKSEQKQASLRKIVLDLAREKYKEFGCKDIKVYIGFNEITNHKELAKEIAILIKNFEHFDTGQVSQERYEQIPEINFIYIYAEETDNSSWEDLQVYGGNFLNIERLKQVISEKEEKAKAYKPCDEYWLLIVIDFINRGQDQELTNINMPRIESEVFSKITIFKTVYNQIIELL